MSPNTIEPLESEPEIPCVASPKPARSNTKQFLAVGGLLLSVLGILGFTVVRHFSDKPGDAPEQPAPELAANRIGKLDMPAAAKSPPAPAGAAASAGLRVAEIDPSAEVDPIEVRGAGTAGRSAKAATGAKDAKVVNPDDAPIFSSGAVPDLHADSRGSSPARVAAGSAAATASASLEAHQRQLGDLMQQLQKVAGGGGGAIAAAAGSQLIGGTANPTPANLSAPPLFGSMERSATPTVQARTLADRSMIMPKGTLFTCSLKTRIITATSGMVGCQVLRNVFSDNGRVLLVERGSHIDGEYRIVQVRPGVTRIPVLWTRVRTPQGVTVDLDSPATGQLGESGIGGYVDNRWGERLGASLLLSLIDDSVKYAVASQGSNTNTGDNNTLVLPNTTAQGSKLAEKVLEATINIPPLLYQNQGGVVGVYVARDIDFSSVYELKPQ